MKRILILILISLMLLSLSCSANATYVFSPPAWLQGFYANQDKTVQLTITPTAIKINGYSLGRESWTEQTTPNSYKITKLSGTGSMLFYPIGDALAVEGADGIPYIYYKILSLKDYFK